MSLLRKIFQTKKFLEEKKEINVWELLRVGSFNTNYKFGLLKAVVNGVMKRNMEEIEEVMKKVESWDEVNNVMVVFEVFEPVRAVWNGAIAQCHVINVMPHVFDSIDSMQTLLSQTTSPALKQGIQQSLQRMQHLTKLLETEIQQNPDGCNPHIILPQKILLSNFEQHFKILALGDVVKLCGGSKTAAKVKTAVRWLKCEFLNEALLRSSKEIDILHRELFGKNAKMQLDEALRDILLEILKRCVESMPGMLKLLLIGIKVTSGCEDEMKLMVQVLEKNAHETVLLTPQDLSRLIFLLCECSLQNGDNFDALRLLILNFSEDLTKVLLYQPKGNITKKHWNWVSIFCEWCFAKYSPGDSIEAATPIVEHMKQLTKNMDVVSKMWFTQAILDYLWAKHTGGTPRTFADWIENNLDLRNWKFGRILNV